MKARVVELDEVVAHINAHDPRRSAVEATRVPLADLQWSYVEDFPLAAIPPPDSASRSDPSLIQRYADQAQMDGTALPAVVIALLAFDTGPTAILLDGAHRIATARQLGQRSIAAYVGSTDYRKARRS